MANSNRQLIQDLYAAFAAGDAASVLGAMHPQVMWLEAENIPYADRNPYIGPAAVAEGVFGRIMSEWEGFTVEPEQLVAEDETVVALGRYRGRFRASGLRLDAQFVHVWTVVDDKIVGFQQYADTAQFARVCSAPLPGISA